MRQVLAFEVTSGLPLYACQAAGCFRLARSEFCCIWCEYSKTFGKPLRRHTSRCEFRQSNLIIDGKRYVITDECHEGGPVSR